VSQNPSGTTYTANLRTKILEFRVFDSNIIRIKFKGWYSHVHSEFPGKFESINFSRDNLSREIVRRVPGNHYRYRCGSIQLRILCVA